MKRSKQFFKKVRERVGQAIRGPGPCVPIIDLREGDSVSTDAREANYVNGAPLFRVSVEKSWALFYPLTGGPFTSASRLLALKDKNSTEAANRRLGEYFEDFRTSSLADLMGISVSLLQSTGNPPTWALGQPMEASVSPWDSAPLVDHASDPERRQLALLPKNRTGDTPSLERLIKSIRSKGYQPHDGDDGDIVVEGLVNGSVQRFVVLSGVQRASVLTALGYKNFRVRIRRIVRREEAYIWPKVKSGQFTDKASLALFDNFFTPPPPPQTKN